MTTKASDSPKRAVLWGLFLLSAATLTFEINLTRLFSVAQFYHFAFLIVSMALLGFGASGTFLAIFPGFGEQTPSKTLEWLSLAAGVSMLCAYLITNWLPFDSFEIAWNPKQIGILVFHYLALSAPFFFSGLGTGTLLSVYPKSIGGTYSANLIGSAFGCAAALVAPYKFGAEGTVLISSGLAVAGSLVCGVSTRTSPRSVKPTILLSGILLIGVLFILSAVLPQGRPHSWLELQISPYKGLSYVIQYPQAELLFRRWNAFSRIDLVRSSGVHSLPGLSYRFLKSPPPEDGLLVDADELNAVLRPGYDTDFFGFLPGAIVYQLLPDSSTLILEPRGGLDVLAAIELGAQKITAVEANPLIVQATAHIYDHERVRTFIESDRSYLRRTGEKFDVIVLSLVNSYHPVRSGAYSLAEDYRYTVESFSDALARLNPGGMLVVTRWLQTPPSESLRAFATVVEAVENRRGDPKTQVVAMRGYNTATLLVKNEPFNEEQLAQIQAWASERAYDMVYAPGLEVEKTNQYNVLPEPIYYLAFQNFLNSPSRSEFYDRYPFDVTAPTDDWPFFGHYFKWSQSAQILTEFGKTWQPFGGAGYFVVVALLILSSLLSALLILLPIPLVRNRHQNLKVSSESNGNQLGKSDLPYLFYFALIGFGFLMAEIPLIQRFILYLGYPAYAMTTVLFSLLLFSGLGSLMSSRLPLSITLGALALILICGPLLLPIIFAWSLGAPLWARFFFTIFLLAPLGFLMGIPFPGGIRWMIEKSDRATLIPWIWAVNGAASVVAAVLAALLALSFGFTWVLWIGALCYTGSWIMVLLPRRSVSLRQ